MTQNSPQVICLKLTSSIKDQIANKNCIQSPKMKLRHITLAVSHHAKQHRQPLHKQG